MLQGLRGTGAEADPIALITGSALFLLGGLAIAGILTMSLATATRAQANASVAQAMGAHVAEWQSMPYSEYAVTTAVQKVALESGSRNVSARYTVAKDALGAYHLAIAAPRWTELGVRQADCTTALTKPVATCLTLSATVSPTPFDVVPPPPLGLTIVERPALRGLTIADIDVAKLTGGKTLDLRFAVKVKTGVDTSKWRVTLTCGSAVITDADSPFGEPDSTGWGSARVTEKPGTTLSACKTPTIRLWADTTAQPKSSDIQEIRAWRVLGAGS